MIASVYDVLVRLACAVFGVAQFGFWAIALVNPIAWVLSALALVVTCRAVMKQVLPKAVRQDTAKTSSYRAKTA